LVLFKHIIHLNMFGIDTTHPQQIKFKQIEA